MHESIPVVGWQLDAGWCHTTRFLSVFKIKCFSVCVQSQISKVKKSCPRVLSSKDEYHWGRNWNDFDGYNGITMVILPPISWNITPIIVATYPLVATAAPSIDTSWIYLRWVWEKQKKHIMDRSSLKLKGSTNQMTSQWPVGRRR